MTASLVSTLRAVFTTVELKLAHDAGPVGEAGNLALATYDGLPRALPPGLPEPAHGLAEPTPDGT